MSSLSIFREPAVRRARLEPVCGKSDWRLLTRLQSGDTNAASRLLTGRMERAQFTPAQHDELQPQPVRTDANLPAISWDTLFRSTGCGIVWHCGKSSRIFGL